MILKEQPTYYDLVYAVVRQIPRGRVTNYGAIADFIALGSSRMVGWALNNCHHMDDIPAHRVVNRKGELTGRHHFSPPALMQQLLENEGIRIENDCIVDFKVHFWHPLELGEDWEAF
jgi:methylated-DNA-protein-cysteine methyltransferase-like protein